MRATPERDPVSQIEDGLTFEVVRDKYEYFSQRWHRRLCNPLS